MTTSVYLIRHGAYQHRPSLQGTEASCDHGLSELGHAQAAKLARRLAKSGEIEADHLFCSTLPRAVQTAELIAPAVGQKPVAVQELCEWESGNEVLGAQTFMSRWGALKAAERRNHRFAPGCETIAEFTERVQTKLGELIQMHTEKSLVLVVHGGVIEAAFHYFLGFGPGPFEGGYPAAGHCSITLWRRSSHRDDWVQEFANDTHHLQSLAWHRVDKVPPDNEVARALTGGLRLDLSFSLLANQVVFRPVVANWLRTEWPAWYAWTVNPVRLAHWRSKKVPGFEHPAVWLGAGYVPPALLLAIGLFELALAGHAQRDDLLLTH